MPFSRPLCTSLYPVSCIGDLSNVNMCLYFEQTPPCSVQDTWLKYKDLRHCVVRLRCKTKINICKYVFLSLRLYSQLHNTFPGSWPCWHIPYILIHCCWEIFCSWNPKENASHPRTVSLLVLRQGQLPGSSFFSVDLVFTLDAEKWDY